MAGVLSSAFHPVTPNCFCVKPRAKVTIVGTGAVGMACAFAIMMKVNQQIVFNGSGMRQRTSLG